MAAKKVKTDYTFTIEDIEKDPEVVNQPMFEDVFELKVKKFRSQGYDDNRIAAMLMVNKEKVQAVK